MGQEFEFLYEKGGKWETQRECVCVSEWMSEWERDDDVGIICVKTDDNLALEAWTQSEAMTGFTERENVCEREMLVSYVW